MEILIQKVENQDGDYEQYETVGAVIILGNPEIEILGETITLDSEDNKEDFYKLESFIVKWETIASDEHCNFGLSDDAEDFWFNLKTEAGIDFIK